MAAKIKVFRVEKSGVMVTEKAAFLVGNSKNFVVASGDGVNLTGKSLSLSMTSEQIRQGGLFIQMNDFVRMVPQTIVTPIPSQIPFPPLGMITGILKDMPFFIAAVAGGAAITAATAAG